MSHSLYHGAGRRPARYHLLMALFLTGMDEHGQKVRPLRIVNPNSRRLS